MKKPVSLVGYTLNFEFTVNVRSGIILGTIEGTYMSHVVNFRCALGSFHVGK